MTPKRKPRRYAHGTKVPVERTRAQIEELLTKHGAEGFINGYRASEGATLVCELGGLQLRFDVPMPRADDIGGGAFGHPRKGADLQLALEAEWRRRWRALYLITKAKLELIATGERALEQEFMADVMLPDRTTVGSAIGRRLREIAEGGEMPPLLMPPREDT